MRDTKQSPDLSPLESDYEIVGELTGSGGGRSYMATRKGDETKRHGDQTGVVITVVTTPEGDEANALTQLAADTQLLARMTHRRLVPVVEGRWIGDDAYAVVTQRITDPSLAQRLATGQTFSNPRIAAILREVNGLLEWAREQKVVHRNITADRVFLEPKTDRVRVSFVIAPIRRLHQSDAEDDARTIARLAMAMLTGEVDPKAYEGQSLAELRPDLPEKLGEATAELLDEKKTGAAADVAAYLALIGMADPLAEGETERDRVRAEILEEQRAEREKLATERAAFEQEMAQARATFEREMAQARGRLEAERAELERLATAERAEMQRVVTQERATLVAKRAELERAAAEQRAEVERVAALDRQRIEALRTEIRTAGELEVEKKRQTALDDITDADATFDHEELATPMFVPPVNVPFEQLMFDDDTPLMRDDDITFTPPRAEAATVEPSGEVASITPARTLSREKWILTVAIAGVVVIIATAAGLAGRRNTPAQPVAKPVAPAPVASVPVAALAAPAVPLPTAPIVDSSAGSVARSLDSTRTVSVATHTPKKVVRDSSTRTRRDSTVRSRRDSTTGRAAMSLSDSIFNFRSTTPVKRDTVVRRDTEVKRDSAPRPDSTTPP
jgi:hypothetical protein